jgi:hypothetical protein
MSTLLQGILEKGKSWRKKKPRIVHKQIMDRCKQWWTISIIGDFTSRTLMVDPRPMNRKLMMAKAISHVKVCNDLPNYILSTKAIGLIFFFSLTCMLKFYLDGQPFLWTLLIN